VENKDLLYEFDDLLDTAEYGVQHLFLQYEEKKKSVRSKIYDLLEDNKQLRRQLVLAVVQDSLTNRDNKK
jgi:hypothetical protein